MRNVVVTEFMTLDGVIQDPHHWSFPFWGDDIAKFKDDELKASDALLLGRVTYEGFAAAWPGRTDDTGFADKFNSMPKYVVTTTLKTADWTNSRIIKSNVKIEIAKLKEQSGQDIAIHGSGRLTASLQQMGLIDRYDLLVYPIVLGTGQRLFNDDKTELELIETKPFSTGVVLLSYRPKTAG